MVLSRKKLSALQADYESNAAINTILAVKYGIAPRTVGRFAKRYGWRKAGLSPLAKQKGVIFTPTQEQRDKVTDLVSQGCPLLTVAYLLQIGEHTLTDHFAGEIAHSTHVAAATLGGVLYRRAIGTPAVLDGDGDVVQDAILPDLGSAVFWLKCRAKWGSVEAVKVQIEPGPDWRALIGQKPDDE